MLNGYNNRMASNEDLNYYFNNHVSVAREDSQKSYAVAEKYVKRLLEEINKKDSRFGKEPIKVGSASQRLKVGEADEFDINVSLMGAEGLQWSNGRNPTFPPSHTGYTPQFVEPLPQPPNGYTQVVMDAPIWRNSSDTNSDGVVIARNVRQTFKGLLNEVVAKLNMSGRIHVCHRHHGPAITINISAAPPQVMHDISVDFAPMFQAHASFPSDVNWPRPQRSWPPADRVEAVKRVGVNAVAKGEIHWLISYNEAEKELRRGMDEDGGCRAKVHRIMKKLKDDVWCPSGGGLSSYHLKNILFWECERFPRSISWTNDQLSERFYSMLDLLEYHLSVGSLPMYFNDKMNIMESKTPEQRQQVLQNIQKFRKNPERWLRAE